MRFRDVYDAHHPFVWRSLRRLGVPESALNDAMQDVFVVVHRRLADFEERAAVTTWLFRICLRTAKDYRRRAHVRREVLDESEVAAAHHEPDCTSALERQDDLALFERAIDKLELEQRAVFILFELEELSGEQIAAALEIPLGTVYSRLRLARQAFKRAVIHAAANRERPAARRLS